MRISIEFTIEADSPWLLHQLDNSLILSDLATRAANDFKRDLIKMNGLGGATEVLVELVNASVEHTEEG